MVPIGYFSCTQFCAWFWLFISHFFLKLEFLCFKSLVRGVLHRIMVCIRAVELLIKCVLGGFNRTFTVFVYAGEAAASFSNCRVLLFCRRMGQGVSTLALMRILIIPPLLLLAWMCQLYRGEGVGCLTVQRILHSVCWCWWGDRFFLKLSCPVVLPQDGARYEHSSTDVHSYYFSVKLFLLLWGLVSPTLSVISPLGEDFYLWLSCWYHGGGFTDGIWDCVVLCFPPLYGFHDWISVWNVWRSYFMGIWVILAFCVWLPVQHCYYYWLPVQHCSLYSCLAAFAALFLFCLCSFLWLPVQHCYYWLLV